MSYEGQIPYLFGVPVPFTIGSSRHAHSYEWRDNEPFAASLEFKGFHRGRSASAANVIYVKDDDPEWKVTMFLTDFSDLIVKGVAPLHVSGRFEFVKRGQNYGIIRLPIT